MGLLKNVGYTIAAILVIALLVGAAFLVMTIGAVLAVIGIACVVIWIIAWIIKSMVESR